MKGLKCDNPTKLSFINTLLNSWRFLPELVLFLNSYSLVNKQIVMRLKVLKMRSTRRAHLLPGNSVIQWIEH